MNGDDYKVRIDRMRERAAADGTQNAPIDKDALLAKVEQAIGSLKQGHDALAKAVRELTAIQTEREKSEAKARSEVRVLREELRAAKREAEQQKQAWKQELDKLSESIHRTAAKWFSGLLLAIMLIAGVLVWLDLRSDAAEETGKTAPSESFQWGGSWK